MRNDTDHLHRTMPNASEVLLLIRVKVDEIGDQWGYENATVHEALWQVQKALTQIHLEINERIDATSIPDAAGETA